MRFRVLKRRRQFDEAALVEVLTASPGSRRRRAARILASAAAARCSILAPAAQLAAKQRQLLDNLERIGGVRPLRVLEPLRGPAFAYRRRARLGVKYVHKKGRVLAGLSRTREALPRGPAPLRDPARSDSRRCPRSSPLWSRP